MSGRSHGRPAAAATRSALLRDTATILAVALFMVLAARWLPTGSPATPTDGPSGSGDAGVAEDTGGAVATIEAPPTPPGIDTLGPVLNPSVHIEATPTPVPFITLSPPTPSPSPSPSATPATATLIVYVKVTNDNGGTAGPGAWTVKITGASPSPATFKGSNTGTKVRILAAKSYTVAASSATATGYTATLSTGCSGKVSAGQTVTCTILENDNATPPPPTAPPTPLPSSSLLLPLLAPRARRPTQHVRAVP